MVKVPPSPSTSELSLLDQILHYGCLETAFQKKWITVEEVLTNLADPEKKTTTHRVYAYYLCCKLYPTMQRVNDQHFLQCNPDITLANIYLRSDCEVDPVLTPFLQQVAFESVKKRFVSLLPDILAGEGMVPFEMAIETNLLSLIVRCSPLDFLEENYPMDHPEVRRELILSGRLKGLEDISPEFFISFLVPHCDLLQTTCPEYWELVQGEYQKIYDKLYRDYNDRSFNLTLINVLQRLFPTSFSANFADLSDLAKRLMCLTDYTKAYLLGFPILQGLPPDDQVQAALLKLSELGPHAYAEAIRQPIDLTHVTPWSSQQLQLVNNDNYENVLSNDIRHYYSFDRLAFIQGNHVVYFTRDEFDNLEKTKKNPYDNQKLPFQVLLEIKHRNQLARVANFPAAGPIAEMLDGLSKPVRRHYACGHSMEDSDDDNYDDDDTAESEDFDDSDDEE